MQERNAYVDRAEDLDHSARDALRHLWRVIDAEVAQIRKEKEKK